MRRLLSLAALLIALWAIDSYAFHGRYLASATEGLNYYGRTLNDGVQGMMKRLTLECAALTSPLKVYFCLDSQCVLAAANLFGS
jgi:hypothetical protein